jgi:O-antigen ligase
VNVVSTRERVGWLLLACWVIWSMIAAGVGHQTLPLLTPYVTAPVSLVIGLVLGRRLVARESVAAAVLVVVSAYLLVATLLSGGAGGGALGYANANAALGLQVVACAAVIAREADGWARRGLVTAAALAAGSTVLARSAAGMVLLVVLLAVIVLAVSLPVRSVPSRLWPSVVGAAATAVTAGGVIWLALQDTWAAPVTRALSSARHTLWRDALELWQAHPLVGSGPGSFVQFSTTAHDPDLAFAHMSLLQVGAETGVIGVVLFVALIGVGFVLASRSRPSATLIVAAALTVLLMHSFIDHLLEFWPILLTFGVTLGFAKPPGIEPGSDSDTEAAR